MIDTKALKNKILDLAISGKLTEQLPEDGSAEELYAQIQEEKARLISEGTIKKEKALPPITEEEVPFEAPNNWIWVRLGCLGSNINNAFADGPFGSNLKREHYTEDKQVRIIQLSNVGLSGWKDENEKYTTFEHLKSIQRSEVKEGNIVIAKMMPAGRAIIVPDVSKAYVLSSDCVKFVPNESLDSNYLCYAINSSFFHDQVLQDVHGIGRERTSLSNLKRYIIPIPPLAEQKRIVEAVGYTYEIIDNLDKAQDNYKADQEILRKKVIDAGIRGKLTEQPPEDGTAEELYAQIQEEKARLIAEGKIKKEKPLPPITEDEIPFEIPENWKWVRWGNCSESIQYGFNAPAKANGRIKMVRISDIQDNGVQWETVPYCDIEENAIDTYLLKQNDILFARTGGTVGKSFFVSEVPEEAIYAGYLIRTRYSALLCGRYFKYFMESYLYWKQLRDGTIATAQPNCNGKTLAKMIVPLPPIAEQRKIVDLIDCIIKYI